VSKDSVWYQHCLGLAILFGISDACLAWLVSGVVPFRFRFHFLVRVRFLLCVVVVAPSWCVLCVVVVAPSWKRRCYVLLLFRDFLFFLMVSFYWFWCCFSSSLWWWGSAGEDLVVVAPAVMFSGGHGCFRCGCSGSCSSGFVSVSFDGWWWQLEVLR
jgi:hypothetical protein